MRIISETRLKEFWESRRTSREAGIARRDLDAWRRIARAASWENWGALTQTFGSADRVGNCVVFDVGNNRYRLIGRVNFHRKIIYVLMVMDHVEYDEKAWIEDCNCHRPPPPRAAGEKKGGASPNRPRKRR